MVYVEDAEQSGRHFVLIFSGKLKLLEKQPLLAQYIV